MNFKNVTHYLALSIVALGAFAVSSAGQALIKQYPYLSGVAGVIGMLAALYRNPKVTATILLALVLFASPTTAQTNVAAPPTFHFVTGGSAINFSANGSNVGSVAYMGLQLTAGVAATYEHITVPSLSSRYEIGVISYTTGLNKLLGSTISSKLVFDSSNLNVTFSGGGGKLLSPGGNHIAETVGASLSYPIPGTSAAIQVLGYQWVHSPNLWAGIQKNYTQQVQTGLIVYF